jgi:hypothetical protein
MKRKQKHNNQIVEINGRKFRSKAEGARYMELLLLEKSGQIHDLRLQVPFDLVPAVVINGKKKKAMRYYADFVYTLPDGGRVIEDVKGYETDIYKMKRHMMKAFLGLDITES